MRVRGAVAGVIVVAAMFVAGCQGVVAGSPTATSDATGNSSSDTSEQLSPPVENPKDLRGIDPCELLSPEDKTELELTGPEQKSTSQWGEEACDLSGSLVAIGFTPDTTLGEGLDQAYRSKKFFDTFAETTVDGYPGVRVDFATQSCGLIVGVSNEQTLHMEFTRVSSSAPGKGDPCGFAEQVMGDVIMRLPDA